MDMARVERMKGLLVTYWGAVAAELIQQSPPSVADVEHLIESWLRSEFSVDVTLDTPKMCDRLKDMGLMRVSGKGVVEWVAPPDQAVEILHKLSPSVIWFDASARI